MKLNNEITIIKKEETMPEHKLVLELDDEHNLIFDIDINYLINMGLEHIKYVVSKSKIKAPVRRVNKFNSEITDIMIKKANRVLSSLVILFKNDKTQAIMEAYNTLNIETLILSYVVPAIIDEVLEELKKDEHK